MKFESKAKKPSVQGANLNAATKGDGLPWNNMNQQCRFTSGEIRTIHMGYALVVFSIAVFAILATTVVVPALRSQSLQKTRCRIMHSDIVNVPNAKGGIKDRCGLIANSKCVQVYVIYKTNDTRPAVARRSFIVDDNQSSAQFLKGSNRKVSIAESPPHSLRSRTIRAIIRYDELQSEQEPCTVRPRCNRHNNNDKKAYRKLLNWKKTLGRVGHFVPCYYDPMKFGYVILKKRFDGQSVFNCLIWPAIFLVLGVTLIVLVHCCIGRYKSRIQSSDKKAPSKTKQKIRSLSNTLKKPSIRDTNTAGKTKTQQGTMFYSAGNVGVGMTKFQAK